MRFSKKSFLTNSIITVLLFLLFVVCYHENYFNRLYTAICGENYDYKNNILYERKNEAFTLSNSKHFDYVFAGDSLTDYFNWGELDWGGGVDSVANRGIAGDTSEGLANRLDSIISLSPEALFIMIGTNDLTHRVSIDQIVKNYEFILDQVTQALPDCNIFFESVLPTRNNKKNADIMELNNLALSLMNNYENVYFLNLYDNFCDPDGLLSSECTIEGLHLTSLGYEIWINELKRELENIPFRQ